MQTHALACACSYWVGIKLIRCFELLILVELEPCRQAFCLLSVPFLLFSCSFFPFFLSFFFLCVWGKVCCVHGDWYDCLCMPMILQSVILSLWVESIVTKSNMQEIVFLLFGPSSLCEFCHLILKKAKFQLFWQAILITPMNCGFTLILFQPWMEYQGFVKMIHHGGNTWSSCDSFRQLFLIFCYK